MVMLKGCEEMLKTSSIGDGLRLGVLSLQKLKMLPHWDQTMLRCIRAQRGPVK